MVCTTVTVEKPAELSVTSIDAPGTVSVNERFSMVATVQNTGNVEGSGDVVFTQDGSEIDRNTITVPGNSSVSVRLYHTIGTAGSYNLCAEIA